MRKGTLKQILLITDGCSNQGEDPAMIATLVAQQGIAVNVIGVLEDNQTENPPGLEEVEEIAEAGEGVSQIVYQQALSQTIQTVTKQAMTQTLQGVVNQELKQILGPGQTVDSLPPEQRGEVMEVVEDLGETCNVEVLVLVDTSASMQNKLPTVKEALMDLSISMNARIGKNRFAIYSFPDRRKTIKQIIDWSEKLDAMASVFPKLTSGGITPTGPALKEAMYQFGKSKLMRSRKREDESTFEQTGN